MGLGLFPIRMQPSQGSNWRLLRQLAASPWVRATTQQAVDFRFAPNRAKNLLDLLPSPGAGPPLGRGLAWHGQIFPELPDRHDVLHQLDAIYKELLASQEWELVPEQPTARPSLLSLSASELTEHLAGWPSPQAEVLRKGKR